MSKKLQAKKGKVYLGGTFNGSTWREYFKPMLSLINWGWFDPVVADGTSVCKSEEIKQRKLCNICIYTITPEMEDPLNITQTIKDSNKYLDSTIIILLKNDGESSFTLKQWLDLQDEAKVISGRGRPLFFGLSAVADWIKEYEQTYCKNTCKE